MNIQPERSTSTFAGAQPNHTVWQDDSPTCQERPKRVGRYVPLVVLLLVGVFVVTAALLECHGRERQILH